LGSQQQHERNTRAFYNSKEANNSLAVMTGTSPQNSKEFNNIRVVNKSKDVTAGMPTTA
jgi:hypothetical protein